MDQEQQQQSQSQEPSATLPLSSEHEEKGLKRARDEDEGVTEAAAAVPSTPPTDPIIPDSAPGANPSPAPSSTEERAAKRARRLDADRYHVFLYKRRGYLLDAEDEGAEAVRELLDSYVDADEEHGTATAGRLLTTLIDADGVFGQNPSEAIPDEASFKPALVALKNWGKWRTYGKGEWAPIQGVVARSTYVLSEEEEEKEGDHGRRNEQESQILQ